MEERNLKIEKTKLDKVLNLNLTKLYKRNIFRPHETFNS